MILSLCSKSRYLSSDVSATNPTRLLRDDSEAPKPSELCPSELESNSSASNCSAFRRPGFFAGELKPKAFLINNNTLVRALVTIGSLFFSIRLEQYFVHREMWTTYGCAELTPTSELIWLNPQHCPDNTTKSTGIVEKALTEKILLKVSQRGQKWMAWVAFCITMAQQFVF